MIYFLKDIKQGLYYWHLRNRACRIERKLPARKMNEPVDFVVTWVDGTDPAWRAEKRIYEEAYGKNLQTNDNGEERYRDWDLFKYWFRAVEKYAPWVRNVYLVTCGQIPEWLNTDAPKLKLVSHVDYIPKENLPTFNSNVIELNFHRIRSLAEHFVIFNDDTFLMRPCQPEDFFGGGVPNHCAIAKPVVNHDNGGFYHTQFAVIGAINKVFGGHVNEIMVKNPEKWFTKLYGTEFVYNKWASQLDTITGMYFSHLPVPMRKSTFEKVWDTFPDLLAETSSQRFRKPENMMHQIMSMWEIMTAEFNPVTMDHFGRHFYDPVGLQEELLAAIGSERYTSICINDSPNVSVEDYEQLKAKIAYKMETAFPEVSSFEKFAD